MRLLYKCGIVLIFFLLFWSCNREKISEPEDDSVPPVTPSDLNVFAAFDGQIGIEWQKNNESNLKGYFIYRSMNKSDHFERISFSVNNYFIDDSLFYDSTYFYKVSAANRIGTESPLSSPVSAIPINIYTPLRPSTVSIHARNWINSVGIKLFWDPSLDTDISGYKIYRSTSSDFNADSLHYLNFTSEFSYLDTFQINLLTNYYYKIIAVDKGGLKSIPTSEVADLILTSPRLIFPDNNSTVSSLTEFRFMAVSKPARYKLAILSNEIYGTIIDLNFSSNEIDKEIKIDVTGLNLDRFRTYLWRVYTYTASDIDPNSYSDYYSFTYRPSN